MERGLNAIVEITRATGDRSIISKLRIGKPIGPNLDFWFPAGLALDSPRNQVLTGNSSIKGTVDINLFTGDRTLGYGFLESAWISLVAVEETGEKRTFFMNRDGDLKMVPTAGSDAKVISANASTSISLATPTGLVVDAANNRALVTANGTQSGIVAIDLSSGTRSMFVGDSLSKPGRMTLDAPHNRVFVADATRIVAVDLAHGDVTALAAANGGGVSAPTGLAYDVGSGRLFVLDANLDALIAIDLENGTRAVISGHDGEQTRGLGFGFSAPQDVIIDNAAGRAVVTDTDLIAVMSVDLLTGDRLILSRAGQE